MSPRNPILRTIKPVLKDPKHVRLNLPALSLFARKFEQASLCSWMDRAPAGVPVNLTQEEKLTFLLVFNSISFSYWADHRSPKWLVEHDGQLLHRGTFSMLAALNRALEEGRPILDSAHLANLTELDLREILSGEGEIPMLKERLQILRNLGSSVQRHWNDFEEMFYDLFRRSDSDAVKLMGLVANYLVAFWDSAPYGNSEIHFFKRAQLLVSDIHRVNGGLYAVEELTACADYILPMVLRHLGILEYSAALAEKVDRAIPLVSGSEEEIEIRALTIEAVQKLSNVLLVTPMQLNDYLWLARDDLGLGADYHRVRTTAY